MPSKPANRTLNKEVLAFYGGPPVREKWLPYGHHTISEDDISAVAEVLRSDWITQGPKVEEFERSVSDYCGAKYGVAFSSGTAGLHAACAVAGLGPGDEVITTPLTFVATANAVVYCGARPVFADIRGDTLNIDPAEVERLITPRTKAIMPVDFAGQPADLDKILSLADKHNLVVIEDACHALGAHYDGRKIGSISHMTAFSFHPVKHITTGEGGMVLTSDPDFARRLRILRHHGIAYDSERPWQYKIEKVGYNYRLSDIHCALGLSQLRRIEGEIRKRRTVANHYIQALSNFEEILLPVTPANVEHAWHLFVVLLNLNKLSLDRNTILQALRAENIGATLHYPLVHLQPFYGTQFGYGKGLCSVAEAASLCLMTLPLFSAMTEEDAASVIQAVEKVVGYFRLE